MVLNFDGMPPQWWHPRGREMTVAVLQPLDARKLRLAGSAQHWTWLEIGPGHLAGTRRVSWRVRHTTEDHAAGVVEVLESDLRRAFGLDGSWNSDADPLIFIYRADLAAPGKYIRLGPYLNIPCPGTGRNGDPNISILVTPEIQEAVRLFLGGEATKA